MAARLEQTSFSGFTAGAALGPAVSAGEVLVPVRSRPRKGLHGAGAITREIGTGSIVLFIGGFNGLVYLVFEFSPPRFSCLVVASLPVEPCQHGPWRNPAPPGKSRISAESQGKYRVNTCRATKGGGTESREPFTHPNLERGAETILEPLELPAGLTFAPSKTSSARGHGHVPNVAAKPCPAVEKKAHSCFAGAPRKGRTAAVAAAKNGTIEKNRLTGRICPGQ